MADKTIKANSTKIKITSSETNLNAFLFIGIHDVSHVPAIFLFKNDHQNIRISFPQKYV